ncbi:carbohydrate binding domain-containing protein [Patescibacteria group bacterium]|nr:carbohydrate binding domain-containing protein [Patescibacteria group bacterium]MBU1722163.1 carbohydrate binding domain-containing protein [Patescibacteria group bacterium]MBU1901114.1 carbohydrate binding domain-containing protein [Patescibacteria group bacterium]
MYKKKTLFGVMLTLGVLLTALPVYARHAQFSPALGDTTPLTQGPERAIVTEDGVLELWSYDGNIMSDFPLLLVDETYVSSPILANMQGDAYNEIAVVVKQSNGQYAVALFDSRAQELDRIVLGNTDIYYDPIVIDGFATTEESLLIVDTAGVVYQVVWNAGSLGVTSVLTLGNPATLGYMAGTQDIFVSYPELQKIEVYTQTQEQTWTLSNTFIIDTAVIYPLVDNGNDRIYGVDRNGDIVAFNTQNGVMIAGFPVDIDDMPLAQPLLLDISEEHVGKEIIVPGAKKQQYVISQDGQIIETISDEQSFVSMDLPAADMYEGQVFSTENNTGFSLWNGIKKTVRSIWSYITMVVTDVEPNMAIQVDMVDVASGTSVDIGYVYIDDLGAGQKSITLQNNGNVDLSIDSIRCINLVNTSCTLSHQVDSLDVGAKEVITLELTPTDSALPISIDVVVESNDPDTGVYTVTLTGEPQRNIVVDGDMEDMNNEWRRWGRPNNVDYLFKTTVEAYQGEYSSYIDSQGAVHAGIQQVNVPVQAGGTYVFRFKYKLLSGELYSILGIRSSNADMEIAPDALTQVSADWQVYERQFTVPADFVEDFRVRLSVLSGEAYIDDIQIEEIAVVDVLKDADLEKIGTDDWRGWGGNTNWRKSVAEVHGGSQSLEVGDALHGSSGVLQDGLKFEKTKKYQVSFWYKLNAGKFYAIIGDNSANAAVNSGTSFVTGNADATWKQHTFIVDGAWFVSNNPIFRMSMRDGQVFVDDIEVTEIEVLPSIVDGDMEKIGTDDWRGWGGNTNWRKSVLDMHGGVQSLEIGGIDNSSGGVLQEGLRFDADKDYELSFWYKVNTGTLYAIIGDNSANGPVSGIPQKKSYATDGEWREHFFMIDGAAFTTDNPILRFSLGEGQAFIDDIIVTEIIQ